MVPQGGNTGLCGGAVLGQPGGVILSLARMADIGTPDPASGSIEVGADLVRAAVPFSAVRPAIWQVYVLIFVLQSASAAFRPTFQATIPDSLPDEKAYTARAALSRLASDLESVVSPMLAAALLAFISFHSLFAGTVIGTLILGLMMSGFTFLRVDAFYQEIVKGVIIVAAAWLDLPPDAAPCASWGEHLAVPGRVSVTEKSGR
ncbi:MFS transporter [Paracoccus mutanolyticus]|uniref:hypothetical protein n=1 Tax=Paracoccus mutanolyticus TaxID=1499308 RepID=UPI001CB8AFE2|nr:hypothetical protein [Paracoccus mutanolyticus]